MSTANYFVTMYETPSHTACTHTVLYVAWLYQCLFWIMSTPLRTPATSPLHSANSSPCSDMLTRTDQHGLQSSRLTLHPPNPLGHRVNCLFTSSPIPLPAPHPLSNCSRTPRIGELFDTMEQVT